MRTTSFEYDIHAVHSLTAIPSYKGGDKRESPREERNEHMDKDLFDNLGVEYEYS